MKKCSKCKETKQESEFYTDKRSKDGLRSQCKECHKGYEQTRARVVMKRWRDNPKFIDKAISGEVIAEDVDWYVEEWKDGNYTCTLHEFLGLKDDDYYKLIYSREALGNVITSRKYESE